MWKKNSNRRDGQGKSWVNRGRSRFTHTERRGRSFQRKVWPEEKQDVHIDNADFGRDIRRGDAAYTHERNEPLDLDRRADNYPKDRSRFYEDDNQTFRETSGPGYKGESHYIEEGYNQRYSSDAARYSNVDDRGESYIDDGGNVDRDRRNIDTFEMDRRYPDQQYRDDLGQNILDLDRRDQMDFDKRDHTDYRRGEMVGHHEDYLQQEDYHRERRLSQENLPDAYNLTQRHDDMDHVRGDDKGSYSRESRRSWKDHKPGSKFHIATQDKIKESDASDRRRTDTKKSSITSKNTYPKKEHPIKKSATKSKLPHDLGVQSKHGHSKQSHHSKLKTESGKHSQPKEKESARALHNEKSGSIGKVDKKDHRSKDTGSTKKIKRDDNKKNEKINPKSSTKNIPKTETVGFKTPQSKFSLPRFRNNSGRKYEHDVGHFHDDDIISIMADDDEFLGDHSQNPSRFSSSTSLNRLNLDERAFGSSRNRTTKRQNTSTSFDKDSQRRPSTHFENDSYASRGMQAGPSSSYFKDHDLNEVNIDIKSPPRGQTFENKDVTVSASSRDKRDYKSHPRQNVTKFHGQNTKSKMVSNSNSKVRVFSGRFSKAGFKKSRFSGFGTGSNVFQRNQNRVTRKEIGKTGAILKDDRDLVNINDDNTSRMSNRKNTFNKTYQGNFKDKRADLNENYRRKDYKVSFKSRRLAYHERVKQKYFKGGFSKKGSERRSGKYTRESHGGYSASDQNKRRDHLYEETDNRIEHLYKLEDNSTRNMDRNDQSPGCDENHFSNDPGQGDRVPLEEQQQIIYITNPNISANQTQMVDQFGHIIFSSDFGGSNNVEQVPVQYIQQTYNPDGTPTGEQVVFIPFINSQGSQGFAENLPLPYGENQVEGQSLDRNEDTVSNKGRRNRSVLSKEARARLRRSLELKRKKRLEAEIEKRLLKRLLQNRNTSAAPSQAETTQTKKKPVIKRISPPSATKPSHADKKFKLVHRGNKKNELEDVSSDNENVYDNVSDLEDVTDSDEVDTQQEKRPGFRKPGQSRMGRQKSAEFQRKETGDVRRVVESSTRVQKGEIRSNAKTSENVGEVYRRSVFLDDAPGTMHKSKDQAAGQKRSAVRYEHQASKKQRSVSPIEITVRNDRYTKDVSKRTPPSTADNKHERNKGKIDSYKHDQGRDRSGYRYEESHDRYLKGNHKNKDGGYSDHKRQHNDEKSSELHRKSVERTEINKEKEKNYKGDDRKHSSSHSRDVDTKETGKYRDEKSYNSSNRIESSRKGSSTAYASDQKGSKRTEQDGDYDDRGKERKHDRERSRSVDKRDKRDRSRSRDKGYGRERSRSKEKKNDSGRSRSKERNRKEDDEYERNRGRRSERGRDERKRSRSYDRHKRHFNETVGGYTGNTSKHENAHLISGINQNQLPMNPVFFQQSMKQPPYMVSQSQSLPLHNQPLAQFQNTSSVDHSLPPVQIAPMQMPPIPPPGLGVNQDMSLPPAMMQLGNSGNMVLHQQPNSFQFQHQVNMQQQQQMQQQYQMQHQQQQQQQFHQMQRQQQVMQSNTPQFQSQQSVNHTNMNTVQSNQLQRVQQVPPNQFQSNYSMLPSNQNIIQNQMNAPSGSMNSGLVQGSTQIVPASTQQGTFIATTPQQALRGVYGTIKHTGSSSQPLIRGSQPLQGTSPVNKGQVGTSKLTKKPVHYGSNQSGSGQRNKDDHYTPDNDDNDDDDDNLVEMLCTKCDKVFLSFELMRRHGKWHEMKESNNKTFRCDQCEQGFSTGSMYTNHQAKKHSRDSWNCSLCDMSFSNSSSLNRHVRKSSHKDLKVKFLCSLCPASYLVLSQLIVHKKENHQGGTGYTALRNY